MQQYPATAPLRQRLAAVKQVPTEIAKDELLLTIATTNQPEIAYRTNFLEATLFVTGFGLSSHSLSLSLSLSLLRLLSLSLARSLALSHSLVRLLSLTRSFACSLSLSLSLARSLALSLSLSLSRSFACSLTRSIACSLSLPPFRILSLCQPLPFAYRNLLTQGCAPMKCLRPAWFSLHATRSARSTACRRWSSSTSTLTRRYAILGIGWVATMRSLQLRCMCSCLPLSRDIFPSRMRRKRSLCARLGWCTAIRCRSQHSG